MSVEVRSWVTQCLEVLELVELMRAAWRAAGRAFLANLENIDVFFFFLVKIFG